MENEEDVKIADQIKDHSANRIGTTRLKIKIFLPEGLPMKMKGKSLSPDWPSEIQLKYFPIMNYVCLNAFLNWGFQQAEQRIYKGKWKINLPACALVLCTHKDQTVDLLMEKLPYTSLEKHLSLEVST